MHLWRISCKPISLLFLVSESVNLLHTHAVVSCGCWRVFGYAFSWTHIFIITSLSCKKKSLNVWIPWISAVPVDPLVLSEWVRGAVPGGHWGILPPPVCSPRGWPHPCWVHAESMSVHLSLLVCMPVPPPLPSYMLRQCCSCNNLNRGERSSYTSPQWLRCLRWNHHHIVYTCTYMYMYKVHVNVFATVELELHTCIYIYTCCTAAVMCICGSRLSWHCSGHTDLDTLLLGEIYLCHWP